MGNRLTKIYTRTGDDGTTGLGDGSRVAKECLRVEAYGTIDEANSAIGVVLAAPALPHAVHECLTEVQHDLFDLGGELCIPGHRVITRRARAAARNAARRVQREPAAAQGIHSSRRRPRRGRLPPRADRVPPRRAPLLVPGARRGRCARGD